MTEDQWNEAGCVPRCLLELANRNGNRITKEQFIEVLDKFSTSDGSLDLSALSFIKILKLLELAAEAKESNNYSVINRDFNAGHKKILIRSEIDLNPGSTKEVKHCSVLTKIDDESFSVWTPGQNGQDVARVLSKSDWVEIKCAGITLI